MNDDLSFWFKCGEDAGRLFAELEMAHEMHVFESAMIADHKKDNEEAFWRSVELAKSCLMKKGQMSEEECNVYRDGK